MRGNARLKRANRVGQDEHRSNRPAADRDRTLVILLRGFLHRLRQLGVRDARPSQKCFARPRRRDTERRALHQLHVQLRFQAAHALGDRRLRHTEFARRGANAACLGDGEEMTLSALISRASAHPSRIEYAANSPGTFPHLATELLASHANVQFTYVPYKGVAQALPDLAGGRISMVVEGLAGLSGAIKARQIQPLAVTSSARLPNFPDLPTVSETLRDYRAIGWFAVLSRRGTAEPILARLHEELARVLASKDAESALHGLSSYPRPMNREALTAFIHEEHKLWGDVVRRIGFKPK